jgi:RNA polymerase sigma-70 factor (ECF subfamily)
MNEDQKIIALYWERSDAAVEETQKKYGKYC